MSLAEAYQGLDQTDDGARLEAKIDRVASDFGKQTYGEQKAKLQHLIDQFRYQVRPEDLNQQPEDGAEPSLADISTDIPTAAVPDRPAGAPPSRPALTAGRRPITIDADLAPDKQIKSIELTCKIDYF